MSMNNPSMDAELIEAHKSALRDLKKAKRLAVLIPLTLLVALIAYVCYRGWDFFHNKVPVVMKEVTKRAPEAIGPVLGEAGASFKKVAGVYGREISKVAKRDWPIYEKLLKSQSQGFTQYTAKLRIHAGENFKTFQGRILANVEKHLAPDLTGAEREEFEKTVAKAMYQRLQAEIKANWEAQMDQVATLCKNFQKISDNTPPLESAKPQYLTGMGLEMLGLQLEEASK